MRQPAPGTVRIGWCLFSFCLTFISDLVVSAPSSSTNYTITRSVIDSGGGTSTSTNYEIQSVVGHTGGASISTNYSLYAGFITITDTDGDGVLDNVDNCINDTNPTQFDTDGDGQGDVCDTDDDDDGLTDNEEEALGTNPTLTDTDGDGLTDTEEVSGGDPATYQEGIDTIPTDADTDNDTFSDGAEISAGSDPLNPLSTPFNPGGSAPVTAPVSSALPLGMLFSLLLLGGWLRIRCTYIVNPSEKE